MKKKKSKKELLEEKIKGIDKEILIEKDKLYHTAVENILDKYAIKDSFKYMSNLKKEIASEKKGLETYLNKEVEKETLEFMNDPKRGYDCKWNSLGRRGRGNSLYAIFKLLDEKEDSWGTDYGTALTGFLNVYKEKEREIKLIETKFEHEISRISDVAETMSEDERILLGKYMHETNILSLGCGSYGTYKDPTTCGACHDASRGLLKMNLKDISKSVGDRTYTISEERIDKALEAMI